MTSCVVRESSSVKHVNNLLTASLYRAGSDKGRLSKYIRPETVQKSEEG
jgi:hypothetical protein